MVPANQQLQEEPDIGLDSFCQIKFYLSQRSVAATKYKTMLILRTLLRAQ
jgi:hypothetical protein